MLRFECEFFDFSLVKQVATLISINFTPQTLNPQLPKQMALSYVFQVMCVFSGFLMQHILSSKFFEVSLLGWARLRAPESFFDHYVTSGHGVGCQNEHSRGKLKKIHRKLHEVCKNNWFFSSSWNSFWTMQTPNLPFDGHFLFLWLLFIGQRTRSY